MGRKMSLFDSGVRPAIDEYLLNKGAEIRDYGDYWSASSAGYCMRKVIFERLGVPPVEKDSDARRTRVFEAGHVFHSWVQEITKNAGLSIAQELQLQDEELMVRGHIDDLILVGGHDPAPWGMPDDAPASWEMPEIEPAKLILYDYKTQNSGAFTWQKGRPANAYHRMQVGTYMYMLRAGSYDRKGACVDGKDLSPKTPIEESRILKISKDDLRLDENQILWDAKLESEVLDYWNTLNRYWAGRKIPPCTCADKEGGFMAKEKFNPYFYNGEPCSIELYNKFKEEHGNAVAVR